MSQLQCTVDRARGYGYRKIGFILDRGYFSKDNIYYPEDNGYAFVMILKGKQDLVQQWVLENKGSFETNRACNIPVYRVYGKTIRKRLFATDKEPRYIHIYHSTDLEAHERGEGEKKINSLMAFLRSHINQFKGFGPGMETYFELHYDENAKKREFPTLIVSGFIVLAALLSFFCGLMLDTIRQKNRQAFEYQLQQIDMYRKLRKQ